MRLPCIRLSTAVFVTALLAASGVTWAAGAASLAPYDRHHDLQAAAAPYEIPGVEIESHDHVPPMIDARGNLYRVTESNKPNGNEPQVMKSSDGGVTWVEQDPLHRPPIGDTEGGWALQDGPTIWFAWQSSDIRLMRFNTSDHPTAPDTYQFQIAHYGDVKLSVDGHTLYAAQDGDYKLRFMAEALAAGIHRVTISGTAGQDPKLTVRFGGQGTRSLSGEEFRHAR